MQLNHVLVSCLMKSPLYCAILTAENQIHRTILLKKLNISIAGLSKMQSTWNSMENLFQFIAVNMALHLRMFLHTDPRCRLFKVSMTTPRISSSHLENQVGHRKFSSWPNHPNYQKEKKAKMKIGMRNESTKSTTLFRNSSSKRVGLIEPVKEDMTLVNWSLCLKFELLSRTGRSLSRKFSMLRIVMLLERTLLNFLRRQSRQNLNLL